jgi:hypothetical protein
MSPSKSLGHGTAQRLMQAISLNQRRWSAGSRRLSTGPVSIFRGIREGRLAAVTNNVAAVLGREPISFDRWAQQNTASFV